MRLDARWATWGEIAAYALLIGAAAALRFWQLDLRAVHHDESMHAFYSWKFFTGEGYSHDPLMHGPVQFFGTRLVFHLFGDSDYTARALPAFWGTLLVAVPYLLRRELGGLGAILVAAMLAISPSFLYFSRFARNDIYIALWSLLIVALLWHLIREGKFRYLYGAAAVLALSFATKETTFVFVAILGSFFLLWQAGELWAAVRHGFSLSRLSPPASCLMLLLSLALPLYAAGLSLFQKPLGLTLANADPASGPVGDPLETKGAVVAVIAIVLLMELAIAIGLRWRGWRYLCLLGIFYGIYVALFTTYLTNMEGLSSGIWGSLGYWLVQHSQNRLAQPWFYYLLLLSIYEFLPWLLGVAGAIYFLKRRDLFSAFLAYWAASSLLLYSLAGEKAPWLVLHVALPFTLLAGKFGGEMLARGRRWRQGVAVLALALLLVFSLKASWQASYQKEDTPQEMLVYAGGAADLPQIRGRIEKVARDSGQGKELSIAVDSSLSWPWVWYLRDYSRVGYPDLASPSQPPQAQVVLVALGHEAGLSPYLDKYGPGQRFRQIIWFPEEYKQWQAADFLQPVGWQRWWAYFWNRHTAGPYYSTEGIAFFPKSQP